MQKIEICYGNEIAQRLNNKSEVMKLLQGGKNCE
jgi:hypothetical protein